jgi:hypothetical protein
MVLCYKEIQLLIFMEALRVASPGDTHMTASFKIYLQALQADLAGGSTI